MQNCIFNCIHDRFNNVLEVCCDIRMNTLQIIYMNMHIRTTDYHERFQTVMNSIRKIK